HGPGWTSMVRAACFLRRGSFSFFAQPIGLGKHHRRYERAAKIGLQAPDGHIMETPKTPFSDLHKTSH
ncbi:MAG: hypothetical protein ACYC6V_06140, partial [Bacillota bacterium]